MPLDSYKRVQGVSDVAANGDVDKTVIAAQGAGTKLRIKRAIISILVAATGGSGVASLEDGAGGSVLLSIDADAVQTVVADFGEEGIDLTANTLLNLTVDGAVTTQASARCTAVGVVLGV